MPEVIIIAGPNGAGKTSFANKYIPHAHEGLVFVNADEIARNIAATNSVQSGIHFRAGREMLRQIDDLVQTRTDFMFETTLASLNYARKIPGWQSFGYSVSLIYLRLPSIEDSIARVSKRVRHGGHDIPNDVIHRRFGKSLEYLENIKNRWSMTGIFMIVWRVSLDPLHSGMTNEQTARQESNRRGIGRSC